jgi:dolichyl-phosphate beta-glucosyltransferase
MIPIVAMAIVGATVYFLYWFFSPLLASRQQKHALLYEHAFTPTPSDDALSGAAAADDYTTAKAGAAAAEQQPFPSVFAEPQLYLSVVVPAYNEEARLSVMLDECLHYCEARARRTPAFSYEVIVVDDGSSDATSRLAQQRYVRRYGSQRVRVLRLKKNQGKGGAVQQGALHASGEYILMADADGATRFEDVESLERRMHAIERRADNGGGGGGGSGDVLGLVVGSRAHLQEAAAAQRKWYRNILMHGFHLWCALWCVRDVRDTQCGFKLFSRGAARRVFLSQNLRRWSFDVELIFIAQRVSVPVAEVAVQWQEIPGSKLALADASLTMARDLVLIRIAYTLGVWRVLQRDDVDFLSASNEHTLAAAAADDAANAHRGAPAGNTISRRAY